MNQSRVGPGGILVVVAGLWLSALPCLGQLAISLKTEYRRYLRYERINATVLLRNYSGNTLVFGDEDGGNRGHLRFLIERQSEMEAAMLDGSANPVNNLILGAGETRELTLVLNTLYDMKDEGTYTVTAQIGHERLRHDYRSDPLVLAVRTGVTVWTQTLGVPTTSVASRIASRTASLLLLGADEGEIYCLRIEDDEMVYGVVRLGRKLSGGRPLCDVDAVSNVHILMPVQPRLYAHRVYDWSAQRKQERFFISDESIPQLHRDPDVNRITVVGGRPAIEGIDYVRPGSRRSIQRFRPTGALRHEGSTPTTSPAAEPSPPKGSRTGRVMRFLLKPFRGDD